MTPFFSFEAGRAHSSYAVFLREPSLSLHPSTSIPFSLSLSLPLSYLDPFERRNIKSTGPLEVVHEDVRLSAGGEREVGFHHSHRKRLIGVGIQIY